jgi:large subunit ribosomal protein L25
MKLNVEKRKAAKKSENNALRRENKIPAIIYGQGKAGETITLDAAEFNAELRKVEPGRLSTTIFELHEKKAPTRRAIVKEIQYDPTNYKVIHLDFEELLDDVKVNVKVPIECIGTADCQGIKLGGVLRQVIRHLRVRCLPPNMPTYFQIDVRDMMMADVKRLSDLKIPETVRPLADLHEVAVVIAKR